MTTDIERELRDLFREKAGEAPVATPAAATQRALRRGRRHQVGTVLGSAAIAVLVAAGSFAALRSLLRDADTFHTGVDPSPVAEPRGEIVELSGTSLDQTWIARFTGAFADGSACIRVNVDGAGDGPLCPRPLETSLAGDQPSLHVVNTAHLALVVGSVPTEVAEIRFTSDSGRNTPSHFLCQMGPAGRDLRRAAARVRHRVAGTGRGDLRVPRLRRGCPLRGRDGLGCIGARHG